MIRSIHFGTETSSAFSILHFLFWASNRRPYDPSIRAQHPFHSLVVLILKRRHTRNPALVEYGRHQPFEALLRQHDAVGYQLYLELESFSQLCTNVRWHIWIWVLKRHYAILIIIIGKYLVCSKVTAVITGITLLWHGKYYRKERNLRLVPDSWYLRIFSPSKSVTFATRKMGACWEEPLGCRVHRRAALLHDLELFCFPLYI